MLDPMMDLPLTKTPASENKPEEAACLAYLASSAKVEDKGFRKSALSGWIASAVFLGAGLPLIFSKQESSGSAWCTSHFLLLFGVFVSMVLVELFWFKSYRRHFSFSKANSIDKEAVSRVFYRCVSLAILVVAGAIPICILDWYYAPVLNLYILALPVVFLFAVFYFFLVERYGSAELKHDDWLVLAECSLAAARCFITRFSLEELKKGIANKQVQNILLGALLRSYFGALLILYYVFNFQGLEKETNQLSIVSWQNLRPDQLLAFLPTYFLAFLRLICTLDSGLATIGYLGAARLLGTELRSVDKTWTAWIVTLICYHPFCQFDSFAKPVFSYAWPDSWTIICPIAWCFASLLILLLMLFYVWSNISFGMAFCNLANRGIIADGPYGIVRHPAYTSKVIVWWICAVPLCLETDLLGSISIIGAMAVVTLIFIMRALTEEKHLLEDPSYRQYCKLVPWRFIPCLC